MNYFCASSLFIYCENHTQSTVIKRKTRNTSVNAKRPLAARQKAISFFTEFICGRIALATTAGVLGNGCPKPYINTFSYYRSTFKRRALLS